MLGKCVRYTSNNGHYTAGPTKPNQTNQTLESFNTFPCWLEPDLAIVPLSYNQIFYIKTFRRHNSMHDFISNLYRYIYINILKKSADDKEFILLLVLISLFSSFSIFLDLFARHCLALANLYEIYIFIMNIIFLFQQNSEYNII